MSSRNQRVAPPPAAFDDRAHSASIGTLATAFCIGGALALLALSGARARAASTAGPADGAPLMRAPLQVVAPVDLKRYAGVWHEQARLPNRFQKQCTGPVSAEYTLQDDGSVEVRNRCILADGSFDESIGNARVCQCPASPAPGGSKCASPPNG